MCVSVSENICNDIISPKHDTKLTNNNFTVTLNESRAPMWISHDDNDDNKCSDNNCSVCESSMCVKVAALPMLVGGNQQKVNKKQSHLYGNCRQTC